MEEGVGDAVNPADGGTQKVAVDPASQGSGISPAQSHSQAKGGGVSTSRGGAIPTAQRDGVAETDIHQLLDDRISRDLQCLKDSVYSLVDIVDRDGKGLVEMLTTDMFKIRSKHMALLEQADNDVIEHERTALDKKLIYKDVVFDLRSNEDAKDQISLKLSEMAHLYCMQRIEKSQQIRACTDAIKFRRTNPQVQVPRQGKMLMEQHNKNTIYNTEGDVGVEVVRIRAIIKDLIKNEVCLIVLDNGMGMSGDRIHAVAPTVNHHLGCCTGKSHCLC
ncbi:hypothetical protein OROMI_018347 [Orobanche minor]